ncbi:MAG: hypothetical protein H0X40_18680 [Chthoniobacterales bacterium]|nr:hypothetical protein [Chthoniobacterales bacterium]
MLFSFVFVAAVTHLLSTAGEIIIASKRIRLSRFNAALDVNFTPVHLRVADRSVGFARGKILGQLVDRVLLLDRRGHLSECISRLACVPSRGEIDPQRFHSEQGRKYLIA